MNFTTTGIEFRTSRPRILRVEHYPPLIAAIPETERQLACGTPILATKATRTETMAVVTPQSVLKRAAQDPSAKPKKSCKQTHVEEPKYSSSSSSTSSSSSWCLPSSPSTINANGQDRHLAEPLKANKWFNAESSGSMNINGQSCELTKNVTGKAGAADPPRSKSPKLLASRGNHQSRINSQAVKKKALKGLPEKRVRFAMDVQEQNVSRQPEPLSETSSSDGSDCSYIDLPIRTRPDDAFSGHTHPVASQPYRYWPASKPIVPQPAKRFADRPTPELPPRSKGQSGILKTPYKTRAPEPIVVMGSGLNKSNHKVPSSQHPAVLKSALKNPVIGQHSTASNDDKENSLQYDERLGLTFRDL